MRAALVVALLVAGCGGADPCDGIDGTCLAIHVDPSTVRELEQLDFDITFGADHGTATSRAATGRTITLPAATAIALGASTAASLPVRVKVSGVLGGAIVGRAEVSVTLARGQHASARLQLGLAGDGGVPDLAADGGCTPGALYCGGHALEGDPTTLYRCTTTGPVIRGGCVAGCEVRPGRDDRCLGAGGPCFVTGQYCGGDKLAGDPQTLYRCDGSDMPPVIRICPNVCKIIPGDDDMCL